MTALFDIFSFLVLYLFKDLSLIKHIKKGYTFLSPDMDGQFNIASVHLSEVVLVRSCSYVLGFVSLVARLNVIPVVFQLFGGLFPSLHSRCHSV